jgi:hypothetical protein
VLGTDLASLKLIVLRRPKQPLWQRVRGFRPKLIFMTVLYLAKCTGAELLLHLMYCLQSNCTV